VTETAQPSQRKDRAFVEDRDWLTTRLAPPKSPMQGRQSDDMPRFIP
jgi:hypothetical protein